MIPVAAHDVASFGLDFRSPTIIGASHSDHAFAGLPTGTWAATLRDPASGVGVSLSSDARWLQVYSADYIDRVGRGRRADELPAQRLQLRDGRDRPERGRDPHAERADLRVES